MSSKSTKLAAINRALKTMRNKYPESAHLYDSVEVVAEEAVDTGGTALTVAIKDSFGKQVVKLKVYDKRVLH